jgi:hypothetical protein
MNNSTWPGWFINSAIATAFYGFLFMIAILYTSSFFDEGMHQKLYYFGEVIAPRATGMELFNCQKNYFLGLPLITLNMNYWAPIVWDSLKYSFIFFLFLGAHRLLGSVLLDPAGDDYILFESRKLRTTMAMHVWHAMEFLWKHVAWMGITYGLFRLFSCKCPSPFLRELISLFFGMMMFEQLIHEKTGYYLTPFVPKRFDAVLLLLIWVEYEAPGRAMEFIKLMPIAYGFWIYKVGRFRERHFWIFFRSYLPPEPEDECYEAYKAYKRSNSLFFNIVEYVQEKVKSNKDNVNKVLEKRMIEGEVL